MTNIAKPTEAIPDSNKLVEHFFRHEYGRLVSVLTKRLGMRYIDVAEDCAQIALSQALHHWGRNGIPENPGGWLFRVASRSAIDAIRKQAMEVRAQPELSSLPQSSLFAEGQVQPSDWILDEPGALDDDQLQLLLVCCAPELPVSSCIALALKVMCGFCVSEIAHALLTSESTIQKRITRAKEKLRGDPSMLKIDAAIFDQERIDAALMVLYLLFNEGYLSTHTRMSTRRDLCEEAIRLATILSQHPRNDVSSVYALLALMSFHIARLDARTDEAGDVLLLESQDRSKWSWSDIRLGMDWMQRSTSSVQASRYHIEAAISWEHCRAARFEDTDWDRICELYDVLLVRIATPIQWLNRAIAESYRSGPSAALQIIAAIPESEHPVDYPIWHAVLGYLHHRNGDLVVAKQQWTIALGCTHSRAEQELLRRRIASCS